MNAYLGYTFLESVHIGLGESEVTWCDQISHYLMLKPTTPLVWMFVH
jgi:hypothetical protein